MKQQEVGARLQICNPVLQKLKRDFVKEDIEGVCSRKQFQWLYVLS